MSDWDDDNFENHDGSFDVDGGDEFSYDRDISQDPEFGVSIEGEHYVPDFDDEPAAFDEKTLGQARREWYAKTGRKGTQEDYDKFNSIFGEYTTAINRTEHGYGGSTVDDLQLNRINNVSGNIQGVIKSVASGANSQLNYRNRRNDQRNIYEKSHDKMISDTVNEAIDGSALDHTKIQNVEDPAMAGKIIREGFNDVLDGTSRQLADRIKVNPEHLPSPAVQIDPKTNEVIKEYRVATRSPEDVGVGISMMLNSAEKYMERGAGDPLLGDHGSISGDVRADTNMTVALEYLTELTGAYIPAETLKTEHEDSVRMQVAEALLDRLHHGPLYTGHKSALPLPNELFRVDGATDDDGNISRITGLVKTQGIFSTAQGTPFNRLEAAGRYDDFYKSTIEKQKTVFDRVGGDGPDQHWKVLKDSVTDAQQKELLQMTPSLANSLYPKPVYDKDSPATPAQRELDKRVQVESMERAQMMATHITKTFRDQVKSHRAESAGRPDSIAFNSVNADQLLTQEALNEAALADVSGNNYAGPVATNATQYKKKVYIGESDTSSSGKTTMINGQPWTSPSQEVNGELNVGFATNNYERMQAEYDEDKKYSDELAQAEHDRKVAQAKRQGGKFAGEDTPSTNLGYKNMQNTVGSSTGGMYSSGDDQSDLSNLLNETKDSGVMPNLDGEEVADPHAGKIRQHTPEWYEARKGKVTASQLLGIWGKSGVEKLGLSLWQQQQADLPGFIGNADTRDGSDGEGKALRSFMRRHGKNLTHTEGYFETNEKYPGMGVSPDGTLKNKDGSSAGVLELKYLSPKSMAKSFDKYYDQLQFQMKITGEKEAHFYALNNKDSTKSVYERISADPVRQEELMDMANEALSISEKISSSDKPAREAQALSEVIISKRNKGSVARAREEQGQTESLDDRKKKEEEIRSFQERSSTPTAESDNDADLDDDSLLAKVKRQERQAQEIREIRLEEDAKIRNETDMSKVESKAYAEDIRRDKDMSRVESKAYAEDIKRTKAMDDKHASAHAANTEFDTKKAQKAVDDLAKATAEASRSMKSFASSAIGIAKDMKALLTASSGSVIEEDQLARKMGMHGDEVRGIRRTLEEEGGLTVDQSAQLLNTAANQAQAFAMDPEAVEGHMKNITRSISMQGSKELQARDDLHQDAEFWMKASVEERVALTQDVLNTIDNVSDKNVIARAYGFKDATMVTENISGDDIRNAVDVKFTPDKVAKAREVRGGLTKAEKIAQDALEEANNVGKTGGFIAGAAGTIAEVGSTATAVVAGNLISGKLLGNSLASSALSKGGIMSAGKSGLMSAAKTGGKAIMSNAGKLAKGGGIAGVTSIASAAAREGFDIEDDGGLADSGLDVLEFAAYGAAMGSVVPGVGTVLGGAIGGTIGLANEAYEYATDDTRERFADQFAEADGVPNDQVVNDNPASNGTAVTNNNIVDVNVNIDKDGVKTEVTTNGEEYMDTESMA